MKNIKSYEDFCNEEINWKKAAAGVALGAGLALGSPSDAISQTSNDVIKYEKPISLSFVTGTLDVLS